MVGVLVLVHQRIAELALIVLLHVLVLHQKLHRNINNVVKVQSVVVLQPLLILLVASGNMQSTQIPACLRFRKHFLGGYQLVLFPADGSQNILGREGLVVQTHVPDDILHDPLGVGGVVNGKAAGVAHPLNVPAENPATGRMEGHGPDVLGSLSQKVCQPLPNLVCRLVGEGDGKNRPG